MAAISINSGDDELAATDSLQIETELGEVELEKTKAGMTGLAPALGAGLGAGDALELDELAAAMASLRLRSCLRLRGRPRRTWRHRSAGGRAMCCIWSRMRWRSAARSAFRRATFRRRESERGDGRLGTGSIEPVAERDADADDAVAVIVDEPAAGLGGRPSFSLRRRDDAEPPDEAESEIDGLLRSRRTPSLPVCEARGGRGHGTGGRARVLVTSPSGAPCARPRGSGNLLDVAARRAFAAEGGARRG